MKGKILIENERKNEEEVTQALPFPGYLHVTEEDELNLT